MSVNPRRTVDTVVRVGSLTFPNPIMLASGTAGHGAELARYLDLSTLGAVVVKSLSATPWAGNPGVGGCARGRGGGGPQADNPGVGIAIGPRTRSFRLGGGGGGVSGPPIPPVAVRGGFGWRVAFPDAAIVGVGGVTSGADAVE